MFCQKCAIHQLLRFFICPLMVVNMGGYDSLNWAIAGCMFDLGWSTDSSKYIIFMMTFQTGFFLESLIKQNVVYAFLRADRIPLIQSWSSITLTLGIVVSCSFEINIRWEIELRLAIDSFRIHIPLPWHHIRNFLLGAESMSICSLYPCHRWLFHFHSVLSLSLLHMGEEAL